VAVGDLAWSWRGAVGFRKVRANLGFGSRAFSGTVRGRMASDGDPLSLSADADLRLDEIQLGKHALTRLSGRLLKQAGRPLLRADELSGKAYGGRFAGFAEVRLTEPKAYGLSLSVEALDLGRFLRAEQGQAAREDVKGLLSGNLHLTSPLGGGRDRRATGQIQITQARIYELPILLGFLHVLNLTLPSPGAFHAAEAAYHLEGDKLVIQRMRLQGSALSMFGAGRVDLGRKRLDLTFLTGPARKLPDSPVKEFLEAIAGQLMTVRVTGTLANPGLKTVPLRNLDATLRELHEPDDGS
jgi:hypothetical protein